MGISSVPPNLKLKIQEYTNLFQEIQRKLNILYKGQQSQEAGNLQAIRVYYAEAVEGKIVVGHQYGEELNVDMVKYDIYALASVNACWLMELADIERFAVDYSITPFFDEPLLTALDGSKISWTTISRLPPCGNGAVMRCEKFLLHLSNGILRQITIIVLAQAGIGGDRHSAP